MYRSFKAFKKVVAIFSTFSLLLNMFQPAFLALTLVTPAYAQEQPVESVAPSAEPSTSPIESVAPSSSPESSVAPSTSPSPEPSILPSTIPTPSVTPSLTLSPEPIVDASASPAPSTDSSPAPPAVSPSPVSSASPDLNEQLQIAIVDHTAAISIENIDLTVSESGSAQLATDKLDYAPTDTALITGAGFLAGTTYRLTISSTDDPATSKTESVTTDGSGKLFYAYQLDGIYRPNYKVEAFLGDLLVATVSFTDSKPNNISTSAVSSVPNPTLSQACGLDIALVLDNSTSIDATELGQMKSAMTAFTSALSGTPTQFSVSHFASTATVDQSFSSNITTVNSKLNSIPVGGGYTNWEDGFTKGQSTFDPRTNPNLVIFASDGNPNTIIGGSAGGASESEAVSHAQVIANNLKTNGTRILALGIGTDLNTANMQAISGLNLNTGSVLTSDVITTDFSGLAAQLATFATQTCGGTITVTKSVTSETNPSLSGWHFTIDGHDYVTDSQGYTPAVPVTTGTYSVVETTNPAYTLTEKSCTKNNIATGSSIQNGVDSISVGANDIISCSFTNDKNPVNGHLIVQKTTLPSGDNTSFSITASGTGTITGSAISSITDATDKDYTVTAGTYSVTETVPAGWVQTSNTCTNVSVVASGTSTCLITNTKQPTLKVTKSVINDNGGNLTATNFPLFIGTTSVTSGAVNTLSPATYTISETPVAGYTQTNLVCDSGKTNPVVLNAGDNVSCVITNNDVVPELTVIKHVVNNNGGSKSASDFTMQVTGSNVSNTSFVGAENPGTKVTLNAGSYSVSEIELAGYAKSLSGDCSGTIAIGEKKTCTITNDDVSPKLTLLKTVINDNGGNLVATNVPLFVGSTSVVSGVSNTFPAGVEYSVSETEQRGYLASVWGGDCSSAGKITLQPGDNKTCTLTNNDIAPVLTFIKKVTNRYGGTLGSSDFPLFINGNLVTSGSQSTLLANRVYTLTETQQHGYTGGYFTGDCSADGTIALSVGDVKTCTIENVDVQPKLTVTKVVVNDNGGTKVVTDFPLFVGNTSVKSGAQNGFNAGAYTVSETEDAGYVSTISGDCASNGSVTLSVGDVKSCTITNDDKSGTLIVNKVVVNDNGGKGVAADFSYQIGTAPAVRFEVDGSNSQTVNSGIYTITEPASSGYSTTYNNCASVFVPNGGSATCIITNNDNQATLTVKKTLVNNNGGSKSYADFSFKVNGGSSIAFDTTGTYTTKVNAGSYSVVENSDPGYTTSYSNCTNLNLTSGGTSTCTITNDDKPGTLIVKKVVSGGTKHASDFFFKVGDDSYTRFANGGQNSLTVNAGTYTVVEQADSSYSASYDNCSGVKVANGGTSTCTITNTRNTGKITIAKATSPERDSQDFNFSGTGGIGSFALDTDNRSETASSKSFTVPTGSYTVTEGDYSSLDWQLTNLSCDKEGVSLDQKNRRVTINLTKDEDVTCTFENTKLGMIVGTKYNDRDADGKKDNGESGIHDWRIDLTEYGHDDTNYQGEYSFDHLLPGRYQVCEQNREGWYHVGDTCQSVMLSAGETETVDFGNYQKARVTVKKDVVDANGRPTHDDSTSFDFSLTGHDYSSNILGLYDEGKGQSVSVKPGNYNLDEINLSGNYEFAGCRIDNHDEHDHDHDWNDDEDNSDDNNQERRGEQSHDYRFNVKGGDEITIVCKNKQRTGDLEVVKYNDIDGDGVKDEGESVLGGWQINLGEGDLSQHEITDEELGQADFRELINGWYSLSETIPEGSDWTQTNISCDDYRQESRQSSSDGEGYSVYITAGETTHCQIGNQEKPAFRIKKSNDATGKKNPGDIITYTLVVDLLCSSLHDVFLTDVTPEGFDYVAGSWTSSKAGVTEPDYGSPGTWDLGEMNPGDVITLTYQAKVGSDLSAGLYNDLAWAQGSSRGFGSVLALGHDSEFIDSDLIFVGTDVEVNKDTQQTGAVAIERESGEVLGASIELPATGADTLWLVLALSALITGLLFIFGGKFMKRLVAIAIVTLSLGSSLASPVRADTPVDNLLVRLEQPTSPTRSNDWKLSFSVLDRESRTPVVTCYVKKPGASSFVSFGSAYTSVKPMGDNGSCQVTGSVISEQGVYEFYVTAVAGSYSEDSVHVSVSYDTSGPGEPNYYSKEHPSFCKYIIKFHTADDGGATTKVEIYSSDSKTFDTNNSSRVGTVNIGSNQDGTFTHDRADNCDRDWYYVIRAFDSAGNQSSHRGDEMVKIGSTTTSTSSSSSPALIVATASRGSVLGELATGEEETSTPSDESIKDSADSETGEVLGEEANIPKTSSYWWIVIAILVVGTAYGVIRKKLAK